ncbi:g12293 [Coccomyxa viridis]|uniref:Ubiquitin thioesterase OTU n=1 Tax=Coccomyxa viridis TaxID=1274662 RepID=A0ABP1GEM7_9CHLO
MNLRCRGPAGQKTLTGLEPSMQLQDFLELLGKETGLAPGELEILAGFPPAPIALPSSAGSTLSSLAIVNGDTLLIRKRAEQAQALEIPSNGQASAAAASDNLEMDEDEQLARAIAASLGHTSHEDSASAPGHAPGPAQNGHSQPERAARPQQERSEQQANQSASSAKQPQGNLWNATLKDGSGRAAVRRVIASDNSCLFNAVGYVMERSRDRAPELRRVIAETVAGNPEQYTEGFLGKPNDAYCKWIQDKQKWGGAIELAILSSFFGREIAAYDIQTKRCDVYGQDEGHSERVMLVYDGLHYDALAVAAFDDAPEEVDITVFECSGPDADAISNAAADLVRKVHEARQFTDTSNFTLRCKDCQIGVKGEKEAIAHAKATGHANFGEY